MTEKNKQKERLDGFKRLFKEASDAREGFLDAAERNMNQYLGSKEIDGSCESALTVRNITYEIIESEISSDVPMPKADAVCYSETRERNAHSVERLCASVRRRLPFEEMNDADERYTYVLGSSVWYVEWENDGSEDGGVKVSCISPTRFFPQPGVESVRDMDHCFLKFTATRASLMREWRLSPEELALCEHEALSNDVSESDPINIIVCFFRDEDGEIGRFVFSGELVLSDIRRYYKRRIKVCERCGKAPSECSCGGRLTDRELTSEIKEIDGVKYTLPYFTPRSFPIVVRRNTAITCENSFGSDCEKIRPEQQAINKIESRILQKLLRAGITPIIPEDSKLTLTNSVFGQVIRMRPGESAENYGKLDTTPDISQDIEEADRLYDQAKRVLGISDALVGADSEKSESGYARELKILQSSSRLESKRRMKYLAYSELYRVIFEHYLAFADRPRDLSYTDSRGVFCCSEFNRYNFYEECDGGFVIYDDYLFTVDLNGGSEYSRELLWEKNLKNLESGTLGDKTLATTLLRYWQSQERAHYPNARENVEYFKAVVADAASENKN